MQSFRHSHRVVAFVEAPGACVFAHGSNNSANVLALALEKSRLHQQTRGQNLEMLCIFILFTARQDFVDLLVTSKFTDSISTIASWATVYRVHYDRNCTYQPSFKITLSQNKKTKHTIRKQTRLKWTSRKVTPPQHKQTFATSVQQQIIITSFS